MTFTAKLLGATATAALFTSAAMAGGLDRSGQPVNALFEEGRHLEFSTAFVRPSLDGVATGGRPTGEGPEDYTLLGFAYKDDINDQLSYAIIFDEPYGSDTKYPSTGTTGYSGITSELNSYALTGLLRYEMPSGFSVYGGLKVQSLNAEAAIPAAAYTVSTDTDYALGYVAGVAYERPEIALRVALTYHSEVDHENSTTEAGFGSSGSSTLKTTTPDAVNLDFQTGVAPGTLVFGRIRWADYSEFELAPAIYTTSSGSPLSSYEDDSVSYTLGIGRAITENFSMAFSVNYEDKGPTADSSALSPLNGRIGYTLGGTYTMDNVSITGGISYTDLGDTTVDSPELAEYRDNDAIAIGLKIAFKL